MGATPIVGMVMLAAGGLNVNPPAMPSSMPNINISSPQVSVQKAQGADTCAASLHDASAALELPGKFAKSGMKDSQAESFLSCVKEAVSKHEVSKLAHSVSYPLTVEMPGKVLKLNSAAQFKAHYKEIFGGSVHQALAGAKPAQLTSDDSGAAVLDDGLLKFGPQAKDDSRIEISVVRPAKAAK
jgi:hypothetical protein